MMNHHLYKRALNEFTKEAALINEVHDLLLRGGLALDSIRSDSSSDIDLTIILKKISLQNMRAISELNLNLKQKYPFKISITVVSLEDYSSKVHHHGIKPLYYNNMLKNSISLLGKTIINYQNVKSYDYQLDCFCNIVYLVHELRKNFLANLAINDIRILQNFQIHTIKRSKHIIRNAIYIMTGIISEKINPEQFNYLFPNNDIQFLELIISKFTEDVVPSYENIMSNIEFIIREIEMIFNLTIRYMEKLYD